MEQAHEIAGELRTEAPHLTVIHGGGRLAVEAVRDEKYSGQDLDALNQLWPTIHFEFNEQHVYGTPHLGTSAETRWKSVYREVLAQAPESLPASAGFQDRRQQALDTFKSEFTHQKIKHRRGDPEIFNAERAMAQLWHELREENHPLAQAIRHIVRDNLRRLKYNMTAPEHLHKTIVGPYQMRELADNLMLAAYGDTLAEHCRQAVETYKRTH